ncbi:MAG: NUDIX domain-containing protein [Proteobacteria bacterium]|nr:NUDIX domain-containing protein [Pseudomonadota bacterium]
MREVKSCGVLLFRCLPERSFLLMRHRDRWDLPKGHVIPGEDERVTALRELAEETGIAADQVELDDGFRFEITYLAQYKRFRDEEVKKTVLFFLGELSGTGRVVMTEHTGHEWFPWNPPHFIQERTVDPLLKAAADYLSGRKSSR